MKLSQLAMVHGMERYLHLSLSFNFTFFTSTYYKVFNLKSDVGDGCSTLPLCFWLLHGVIEFYLRPCILITMWALNNTITVLINS